jgi:hypothetical protein
VKLKLKLIATTHDKDIDLSTVVCYTVKQHFLLEKSEQHSTTVTASAFESRGLPFKPRENVATSQKIKSK